MSAAPSSERPPVWVVSFPERQSYAPLWELQKRLWAQRHAGRIPDTLLLLEHEPVVTLGKNARRENLLLPRTLFAERGIEVLEVDRGGDVTYHGPGQLVGYWIFDLRGLRTDVHWYLRNIEEVLIRSLRRFGLEGSRDPKATGVWVEGRKVAALGLHLSHWVSTHGFALNITTDLAPFSWIVPCGLVGREVTSMKALLGRALPRAEVEDAVTAEVSELFARAGTPVTPLQLSDILMALEGRARAGLDGDGLAGDVPAGDPLAAKALVEEAPTGVTLSGEAAGGWKSRSAPCPA